MTRENLMDARYAFILIVAGAMAGCGSGGGTAVAGIDARGTPARVGIVSKGTITGFGSIVVNGIRFDTNGATIEIDGVPGSEGDLAVGDVVVVQGTIEEDGSAARAVSVSFGDLVEGPVASIDSTAGTIIVLGQLVVIDADTSFDDSIAPASIDGIAIGDVVEISGFFLADGRISATRIEKKLPGGQFEVTGIVTNPGADTFQINDLVVDFKSAQLDDFPTGAPEAGQLVEAKGDSLGNNGGLLATRVQFKGGALPADNGDRAEIEGFITRFASPADFDVEGIAVTTNASTAFVNGAAEDLALNRKIEAEGVVDANGVLVASQIEIKLSNFIRIEGLVDDRDGNRITIFGITIHTDALTRFEDKSAQNLDIFRIDDIVAGDYLETRGYEDASGVVATLVEREDFDGEVALRGFVESINDPDFAILGVTIQTSAGTEFRDINDQPITVEAFFSQASGRLAEAKGVPSNGGIAADDVEFEN